MHQLKLSKKSDSDTQGGIELNSPGYYDRDDLRLRPSGQDKGLFSCFTGYVRFSRMLGPFTILLVFLLLGTNVIAYLHFQRALNEQKALTAAAESNPTTTTPSTTVSEDKPEETNPEETNPAPVPVETPETITPVDTTPKEPVDFFEPVDPASVFGKSKEAYIYLFCTMPNADEESQFNFEALKAAIFKLQKIEASPIGKGRDIIVMACQYVPYYQYQAIKNFGVIINQMVSINPPEKWGQERWVNNYSKFHPWRFINWDRVLLLDIDIWFTEKFLEIWDEPSTQIIYEPKNTTYTDETYYGFPVKDLYPYLMAASLDSWDIEYNTMNDKFNTGVFMIKPSITHFHLIMKSAFNRTEGGGEMEQSTLNIVYHRNNTTPIPWTNFSIFYNCWPRSLGSKYCDKDPKGYHGKFWKPDCWEPMKSRWADDYAAMKAVYTEVTVNTTTNSWNKTNTTTLEVGDFFLSSGTGTIYAVASTNTTHKPSADQIMSGFDVTNTFIYGIRQNYKDKPVSLKFENLKPNTNYTIYYCAYTDNAASRVTTVYYIPTLKTDEKTD